MRIFTATSITLLIFSANLAVAGPRFFTPNQGPGLGFTNLGLDPKAYIQENHPDIAGDCSLRSRETPRDNRSHHANYHEYYDLFCFELPVEGAALQVHYRGGKASLASENLPRFVRGAENRHVKVDWSEHYANVGSVTRLFMFDGESAELTDKVLIDEVESATYLYINPESHVLLREVPAGFGFTYKANVYQENPRHGVVIEEDIETTVENSLETANIFVYPAKESGEERAIPTDGAFRFSPHIASEQNQFDQVQSFYSAKIAQKWFTEKFGYDFSQSKIQIHIDSAKNNARYFPTGEHTAKIEIGKSNANRMINLGRDNDVIAHEFSHHVIFRFIKSSINESAMLHEGYADYFAYAMQDNPFLGESVLAEKDFLRTAILFEGQRFDHPDNSQVAHLQGRFWSALLWRMREKRGPQWDNVVYESLKYMQPNGDFRNAFIAIIEADKDIYLSSDGNGSENYCDILTHAIDIGFVEYLEGQNGDSCGIDISAVLAAGSEDSKEGKTPGPFNIASCAVVGVNTSSKWHLLLIFVLTFMINFWPTVSYAKFRLDRNISRK